MNTGFIDILKIVPSFSIRHGLFDSRGGGGGGDWDIGLSREIFLDNIGSI